MQDSLEKIVQAFDQWAPHYDAKYAGNPVMARFRGIFRERALAVFPPGGRLLEIGAGTGEETLFFAERGFDVRAVDPSPGMLERLRARAAARGLRIACEAVSTRGLGSLAGPFEGAFAFWGPLNYDEDWAPLAGSLRRLLKPGAPFVFTSVNRLCLWEMGYYGIKGPRDRAFRRLSRSGVAVKVGEVPLRAYCPPWSRIRGAFSAFSVKDVRGLGVFLPPPALAGALGKAGWRAAAALEEGLAHRWPFRWWGDQLLVTLEAK
jgi:SAM-dependent methyltransferase